jgi:hypothetical protein
MEVERRIPPSLRADPKNAPLKWRVILPWYLGRLCPAFTPERDDIGISMQFATGASLNLNDGSVRATFLRATNGRREEVWVTGEIGCWVGERMPEKFGEEVLARRLNKDGTAEYAHKQRRELTYVLGAPEDLFSFAVSLVPFLQHNDPVRALMGAKLLKEALPLREPEVPLVATGLESRVLEAAPTYRAMLRAPAAGQVVGVDRFSLDIRTPSGETVRLPLLLGSVSAKASAAVRLRPRVKPDDQVCQGQEVADGPGMRDGQLALGTNLLVAYLPFEGLNFEDAIVISESASRKLTSVHLYRLEVSGVSRVEVRVQPGDRVVGGQVVAVVRRLTLTPEGVNLPRTGGDRLQRMLEQLQTVGVGGAVEEAPPEEVVVPGEVEAGEVVRAEVWDDDEGQTNLSIWVYEERPARVGDKLSGRHGNKGVISRVLPDDQMPFFTVDGQTWRVEAVLNPLGVLPRLNWGQLLETHWGWVRRHRPEAVPAEVGRSFGNAMVDRLEQLLVETGLDGRGKVQLYDGRTQEPFHEKSVVGYQYFVRLPQLAAAALAVRGGTGPRSLQTGQPVAGRDAGGQRLGEMEVWALRAHGAYANLAEALGPKSDDRGGGPLRFGSPLPARQGPETLDAAVVLARGALMELQLPGPGRPVAEVRWLTADAVLEGSRGEVKSPELGDNIPDGLYSERIFGRSRDERRRCFGHIELAWPVIHPWRWLGLLARFRRPERPELKRLWEWRDPGGDGGTEGILSWVRQNHREAVAEVEGALIRALPVVPPAFRWRQVDPVGRRIHLDGLAEAYRRLVRVNNLCRQVKGLTPDGLGQILSGPDPADPLHRFLRRKVMTDSQLREVYKGGNFEALKAALERRYQRALHRAVGRLFEELRGRIDGKWGIIRHDLPGKRVDYSARAVIVPAPELRPDECYVPVRVLWELLADPLRDQLGPRRYDRMRAWLRAGRPRASRVAAERLNRLIAEKDLRVLLNRTPTLHKYNLVAFRPRAWAEDALGFPPLCCGPFNADFDGDTMAVFLPVSREAQAEARTILDVGRHLYSAASGRLLLHLTQDIVLGVYYLGLTSADPGVEQWKEGKWAELAEILHLGKPRRPLTARELAEAVDRLVRGRPEDLFDRLRRFTALAFEAATRSGLSLSFFDLKPLVVPPAGRGPWLEGLRDLEAGTKGPSDLEAAVTGHLLGAMAKDGGLNPLAAIYLSGARGRWEQVVQTLAVKGRARNEVEGRVLEALEIRRNLFEGLSPFEFYMACHGARASLIDKKVNVAKGGHITRELVESAGHIRIHPDEGKACAGGAGVPVPLEKALGRFLAEFAVGSRGCYGPGAEVTPEVLADLRAGGQAFITVRSPATCRLEPPWVCRVCYGRRPPLGEWPRPGEEVGVLAAQSVGERGTQLSMQTFHAGGMARLDLDWARRLLLNGRRDFGWEEFWKEVYQEGSPYRDVDPRHFEVVLRPRLGGRGGRPRLLSAGKVAGDPRSRGFLSAAAYRDAVGVLVEAAEMGLRDDLVDPKAKLMINWLP